MNYQDLLTQKSELESREFIRTFQTEFENECAVEYKKQFPRKRKPFERKNFKDLSNGQEIFDRYAELVKIENERRKQLLVEIELQLAEQAKYVDLTPSQEIHQVKFSDGGHWYTQGFGANKYAKGELIDDCEMLKRAGFDAKIVIAKEYQVKHHFDTATYFEYALETNATEIQYDAVKRTTEFNLQDWIKLCWNNHVNPRVYMPFLTNEDVGN